MRVHDYKFSSGLKRIFLSDGVLAIQNWEVSENREMQREVKPWCRKTEEKEPRIVGRRVERHINARRICSSYQEVMCAKRTRLVFQGRLYVATLGYSVMTRRRTRKRRCEVLFG